MEEQGFSFVTVGFMQKGLEESGDGFGCFEALVDWWISNPDTGGRTFRHVEVRFSDGFVTSITKTHGYVHYFDGKLMQHKDYCAFYKVRMESWKERQMQEMARQYAEDRVEFNKSGELYNFLPLLNMCLSNRGHETDRGQVAVFCSQYIVLLFQRVDMLTHLDAAFTTPNDLYVAVRKMRNSNVALNMPMRIAHGTQHSFLKHILQEEDEEGETYTKDIRSFHGFV